MPPTAFSMWSLLKVTMDLKQEGNTALASQHYSDKFKDGISQESLKNSSYKLFPIREGLNKDEKTQEKLDQQDEPDLEEEAARYHNPKMVYGPLPKMVNKLPSNKPLIKFSKSLWIA